MNDIDESPMNELVPVPRPSITQTLGHDLPVLSTS